MLWVIESGSELRALHVLANLAKPLECVQLAGAFGPPTLIESGSKLHALHALANLAKRLESASSLLALSGHPPCSKPGASSASSTHSKRFARSTRLAAHAPTFGHGNTTGPVAGEPPLGEFLSLMHQ